MPLFFPDPLFKGITTSPHRKALHTLIVTHPSARYFSPGAGQFSDVETLVDSGVKPEQIVASDITLFSSVLGYLLDPTKHVQALGFVAVDPPLVQLIAQLPVDTELDQAAVILLSIKWAQLFPKNEFLRWQRLQFEADIQRLFVQYREGLTKFQIKCSGLTYGIRDMLEHTKEFEDDPSTCMIFSPPWYAGGYTKMFKADGIYSWKIPAIAELVPTAVKDYFNALPSKPLHSLAFVEEKVLNKLGNTGWHLLMVEQKADYSYRYLLSSQAVDKPMYIRRTITSNPAHVYPVYDDQVITEDSDVRFISVAKNMAMYYYDLFIKGLGMPGAEAFALLCVDGRVAGVTGLHYSAWRIKRQPVFMDVFSITLPQSKYKLGRLMTHLLCTREIAEQLSTTHQKDTSSCTVLEYYQTTFLSSSPSIMKVRGLMKLLKRENMPNGMFKLVYRASLKPESTKDVLHGWLAKDQ